MPEQFSNRYLTLEDIRSAVGDAQIRNDAPVGLDMEFSDEEIEKAMLRCLRAYNSLPPYINVCFDAKHVPGDTEIFVNGTLHQLYLVKWQQVMRDDIPYEAGSVKVDDVPRQIEHLANCVKVFGDKFETEARNYKRFINIRAGYGQIGQAY